MESNCRNKSGFNGADLKILLKTKEVLNTLIEANVPDVRAGGPCRCEEPIRHETIHDDSLFQEINGVCLKCGGYML